MNSTVIFVLLGFKNFVLLGFKKVGEMGKFGTGCFFWVFFLVITVGYESEEVFSNTDGVSLGAKNFGSVSGGTGTKQIRSLPPTRPRHTFQGAFFVSNVSGGPARGLQTVQPAPETAVFPSPLKS